MTFCIATSTAQSTAIAAITKDRRGFFCESLMDPMQFATIDEVRAKLKSLMQEL